MFSIPEETSLFSLKLQRDKLKQYQKKVYSQLLQSEYALRQTYLDSSYPWSWTCHRESSDSSWTEGPSTNRPAATEIPTNPSNENGSTIGEFGATGIQITASVKHWIYADRGLLGIYNRILSCRSFCAPWIEARKWGAQRDSQRNEPGERREAIRGDSGSKRVPEGVHLNYEHFAFTFVTMHSSRKSVTCFRIP